MVLWFCVKPTSCTLIELFQLLTSRTNWSFGSRILLTLNQVSGRSAVFWLPAKGSLSDSLIIMVAHPGMFFFALKRSTQRRPVFCFADVLSMPTCSSIYYTKLQTSVALHLASATKCLKPCSPDSQAVKSLTCLPARLCLPDSWAWMPHLSARGVKESWGRKKHHQQQHHHHKNHHRNHHVIRRKTVICLVLLASVWTA